MKVTNLTGGSLFLNDLWAIRESQNQGRRGEGRYIPANSSVYFQNTSEVLRSAQLGTLAKWRDLGLVTLEDLEELAASNFETWLTSPTMGVQMVLDKRLVVTGPSGPKAIALRKAISLIPA